MCPDDSLCVCAETSTLDSLTVSLSSGAMPVHAPRPADDATSAGAPRATCIAAAGAALTPAPASARIRLFLRARAFPLLLLLLVAVPRSSCADSSMCRSAPFRQCCGLTFVADSSSVSACTLSSRRCCPPSPSENPFLNLPGATVNYTCTLNSQGCCSDLDCMSAPDLDCPLNRTSSPCLCNSRQLGILTLNYTGVCESMRTCPDGSMVSAQDGCCATAECFQIAPALCRAADPTSPWTCECNSMGACAAAITCAPRLANGSATAALHSSEVAADERPEAYSQVPWEHTCCSDVDCSAALAAVGRVQDPEYPFVCQANRCVRDYVYPCGLISGIPGYVYLLLLVIPFPIVATELIVSACSSSSSPSDLVDLSCGARIRCKMGPVLISAAQQLWLDHVGLIKSGALHISLYMAQQRCGLGGFHLVLAW